MSTRWRLHPQLARDTHRVFSWALCDVRLMNDAQYPWLILVPRVHGAVEICDLPAMQRKQLWDEVDAASHLLRRVCVPDKLNIAALGNMVPQLHVHVIARKRDDAAWPAPVWGKRPARPYAADALQAIVRKLHCTRAA